MSDSRYSYDENAEVWPYFAMTLLSLVLVPTTYKISSKALKTEGPTYSKLETLYKPSNHALLSKIRKRHSQSKTFTKGNIAIIIGWIIFAAIAVLVYTQETPEDLKRFDPYEILGIPYTATDKEIKSKYRKLSLTHHPDKIRNVDESARAVMEALYVEMTKAYKSLTDEEIRKNYLEYGHPDGPQPIKQGIALPKWLVDEKGTPLVIAGYAILIGIILPFIVWKWWSGTKKYTKAGIHTATASRIFETFAKTNFDDITYDVLIEVLSQAEEYAILCPELAPAEIYVYLQAYLAREQDGDKDEFKLLAIVSRSITILEGMQDIASSFKNVGLIRRILLLIQAFAQAVQPESNELLQLPLVSSEVIAESEVSTIKRFCLLNEDEQKALLGLKSEDEYKIVKAFVSELFQVEILASFFKVPGEDVVSPGSLAHLVIKYRVYYPGMNLPPVDPKDLEEPDTPATLKKPLSTNDDPPLMPAIYAPFLPIYIQPKWNLMLINPRENKIVEPPSSVTRAYTDGRVSTFKVQLSAPLPNQLGKFRLLVEMRSNCFIGADALATTYLPIEEASQVEVVEDDISDPEEDSIAGTMAQLRGQKTKRRPLDADEDEDDDEDDSSAEDEEDSDTDINTDTDDES
ncbi:uncharacterized protein V1516DRAFT_680994 [Lipomyces oligophaga]|uniref:uncharacterized protein n=1 Tax=Lipomyces oligophaga TaxID=45792 RepID=UPI0034CE445D